MARKSRRDKALYASVRRKIRTRVKSAHARSLIRLRSLRKMKYGKYRVRHGKIVNVGSNPRRSRRAKSFRAREKRYGLYPYGSKKIKKHKQGVVEILSGNNESWHSDFILPWVDEDRTYDFMDRMNISGYSGHAGGPYARRPRVNVKGRKRTVISWSGGLDV